MLAIWKKELKSYFHSVTGYLYIAVILFFTGIYFTVYNLLNGFPYIAYTLSGILMVFMIVTPLLTMRIMSEEKKQKTDQLLFTSPVSAGRIILGKYLSMLTVFSIPMAVIAVYPLILAGFGEVPVGESYTAVLGFYLFGAACLAAGLFISALTESQIIAAILTFAVLLLGFLFSGIVSAVAPGSAVLSAAASVFDLSGRLTVMMDGSLDLTCALYFVTIVCLFLFFTYELIQKRRYSVSAQGIKTGVFSVGLILAVTACFAAGNYLFAKLPSTVTQIDMTSDRLYTVSDQTKEILAGLETDIDIFVLADQADADPTVEKLLARYEDGSSHISVEYRDPERYPNFSTEYTTDNLSENSLIVAGPDKSKAIEYRLLFETQMDYTYSESVTGFDGEGQLTSAISYVLSDSRPKMYSIVGHDEAAMSERLSAMLSKANIDWEEINLINYEAVPGDAQCIFIFAPISDFSKEDAEKVKDYLKSGGHALIITSWTEEPLTNFEGILAEYGDSLTPGVVAEGEASAYTQNPFYLLPEILPSELTETVTGRTIYLPFAQGIETDEEIRDTVATEALLMTTESAYSKEDIRQAQTYEKEEGDREGPFQLGVLITEPVGDKETRIVHFTTENMLTDTVDDAVAGANMELVMSSIRSMVDETAAVSIPVKRYSVDRNVIDTRTAVTTGAVLTLVIPILLLITGIAVWAVRRRK